MYRKRFLVPCIILCAFSILSQLSCARRWSVREFSELPDKTFYLSRFDFVFPNQNINIPESCNAIASAYPLGEVVTLLESKYKIRIDTTDFENARKSGISSSPRFVRKNLPMFIAYAWESERKNKNTIELNYFITSGMFSGSGDYYVDLKVNSSSVASFSGGVGSDSSIKVLINSVSKIPDSIKNQIKDID